MTIESRSWRRALVLVAAIVGTLIVANPAQAQVTQVGARADKDCPGATASPGDTITCNFEVENTGALPAVITELVEISPYPGGAPVNITCTAGGITYGVGATLPNGVECLGTFTLVVPNDPGLCGTVIRDRVQIELSYNQFTPPLTAGAFATHTTAIVCPADISVTKTADALSKVGDAVNYTICVTNNGEGIVNRVSVIDTLVGNITAQFPATLAPGASFCYTYSRVVLPGDPDPLVNTVTAIYGTAPNTDTATASATTNLFQPAVTLDKSANVSTAQVGDTINYTIVVSNTGSPDSPACVGNVVDPLLGINQAVSLAAGASITITDSHTVLATDPDPLVNTATLTCSPAGFPNVLTAKDSVTVDIVRKGGEGCTPGFWKQDQHFDSWVGYSPTDSFEDVFGVDVPGDPTLLEALNAGGGGINALMRHAVAALLNASNPDVDSDFTVAEVIALVQEAIATGDYERIKDILAAANEQGCPLN
jgi:uncharacterized repeat protein (TIGR01451 family)